MMNQVSNSTSKKTKEYNLLEVDDISFGWKDFVTTIGIALYQQKEDTKMRKLQYL